MKIAITSTGPTLDDTVEARFGRAPYFLIVDPGTMEFESMQNPNVSVGGGAGPQSAQLMADNGVSYVLTGNCGPNAFRTFGAAGIQVISGVSGPARKAVEDFNSGNLGNAAGPGMQGQPGMGGGRGGGRGMGGKMGRGRGTSPGATGQPAPGTTSKQEALEDLKTQAEELRKQMENIQSAIKDLEKE